MKKIFLASTLCFPAIITVLLLSNNFNEPKINTHEKIEVIITSAKLKKNYTELNEVEKDAKLVVIGKKIGDTPVLVKDDMGDVAIFYTISDFIIEKVIKNETNNQELIANNQIKVMENAAKDTVNNRLYSTAGYKLMEKNDRYALYLTPNRTEEDVFNTVGSVYGKYSVEKIKGNRDKIFLKDNDSYEEDIKYNNINIYNEFVNELSSELN